MQTEYKTTIIDDTKREWKFSCSINVTIDEGCVDRELIDIILTHGEEIKIVESLAVMPTEFNQSDINDIEREIERLVEREFFQEIQESCEQATLDHQRWREAR